MPTLRLPGDVRPRGETIALTIDPRAERFSGIVDIEVMLGRPRSTLWLHGQGLHVSTARVTPEGGTPRVASWLEHDEKGTASLTLADAVPMGRSTIHIEYDAPFSSKQEGLFKLTEAELPYAFTQFENIAARQAFPCFDEPGFKIPWDVTLVVPEAVEAIANTRELSREKDVSEERARVHFARTEPLPSYLIAFAVGPLDVVRGSDVPPTKVRARALPLRGVATHGHGPEMAYALAHTGEILATLEQYFGVTYPYDKVDIIAIPDMQGAMENAAALTFNDGLLLFDAATAPWRQRRAYADVMTHELAHQWVGDLVTATWWDDIWLNEAFATWMEAKADVWDPRTDAMTILIDGAQDAMVIDALTNARAIRQPVLSVGDIANAFDNITYSKGGAVLRMFERWVGPDTFRRGLTEYLTRHHFGSATADDFLDAESRAAGKDVKTPFRTFLDQPGVPYVEATVLCDGSPRLHLTQTRYLPVGSLGSAGAVWQVPLCARYGHGALASEACMLLASSEGDLALGAVCPDWVFPNADAVGYFRFSLAPKDLAKLRASGYSQLTPHERVALGNSVHAALDAGKLSLEDAIVATEPLAIDSHADVVAQAMDLVALARRRLHAGAARVRVEAFARDLFRRPYRSLGWERAKGDDGPRIDLRVRVLGFLATTARDPGVRAEATRRAKAYIGYRGNGAIHRSAVDSDLASVALRVLGEDADEGVWEALRAQLIATDDAELRTNLIEALSASRSPDLAARARGLCLDRTLRATEVLTPLVIQLAEPDMAEEAWRWIKAHWDALLSGVTNDSQSQLVSMASVFCDEAHVADVMSFLSPRISGIDGGPRELAKAQESMLLCNARRAAEERSARSFFSSDHVAR